MTFTGLRFRLAAKAAAKESYVARNVFFFQSERLRDFFLHALWILRRRPNRNLLSLHISHRDGRFHRSMCKMRGEVFRFDNLAALGKFGIRIAGGVHDFAGLARGLLQFFLIFRRVIRRVRAVVPLDFQVLASLESRKRVVGYHGNAAERLKCVRRFERIHRNRFLDANDFEGRGIVCRLHFSSQDRWMCDGRVEHAIDANVHAEQRLA